MYATPVRMFTKGLGEKKKLYVNIASCIRVFDSKNPAAERDPPNCKLEHAHVVLVLSNGGRAEESVVCVPCVVTKEAIEAGSELLAEGDSDIWRAAPDGGGTKTLKRKAALLNKM